MHVVSLDLTVGTNTEPIYSSGKLMSDESQKMLRLKFSASFIVYDKYDINNNPQRQPRSWLNT